MRTVNINEDDHRLKALVYGRPGTGKTTFGVSAPRPLILASEKQAIPHIKRAASIHGVAAPMVLLIDSVDDYRHIVRALHGDKSKPFRVVDREGAVLFESPVWPETVVLDSLTDACDLIVAEIRKQAPPQLGTDGLPVDSQRFWNVLKDRSKALIKAFRDAPVHVLFLALLDDKEVGEGKSKSRRVMPQLPMRTLPGIVQAAVNVVGVTYRQQTEDIGADGDRVMEWGILTNGPSHYELKPFPPLRDRETTDFADWVKRLLAADLEDPDMPSAVDITDAPENHDFTTETEEN